MRTRRFVTGIAMAGVVCAAGPGSAADMCFTLPGVSGFIEYALKSFTPPGKNRCKQVAGFTTAATPGWLLGGTACTKSDGTVMRLALHGDPLISGPVAFQGGCTIPLPTLTGGSCLGTFEVSSTTIGFTSSIDLSPCTAKVP